MQKNPWIIWLFLLIGVNSFAQEKFTVSGSISDAETGETLIGATVFIPASGEGTITNEYGFYSITLPAADSVTVEFSYVGFTNELRTIPLQSDQQLSIELGSGIKLEEVVVKANSFQEQLTSTEMSVEAITTKEAKLIPVLLGESDIIKTIQLIVNR